MMRLLTLICILVLAQAHGQTTRSDTVCVGDAVIVPADSVRQPIATVKPSIRDYVDFEVTNPNGDNVSAVLFNAKGDTALIKNVPTLPPNRYIIRFRDVRCPGVYFVRLTVGNQIFTRPVTLLQQSSPPRSNPQVNESLESSVVDGVWEKSYTQMIFPSISTPEEVPKPDSIFHQIVLRLYRQTYELKWIIQGVSGHTQSEKYDGRFLLNVDTLKLLDAQTEKVYQFQLRNDSLRLNLFHKAGEPYAVHVVRPTSPTLILEGIYRRRNLPR